MTALPNTTQDPLPRNEKLLTHIQQLVSDAHQERRKHEDQWLDDYRLVLGAHKQVFGSKDDGYVTADQINHTVVLQWSVATETAPRIIFRPRETNEPPDWFLKRESASKLDFVPGHGLSMGQIGGVEAIDDALVQRLLAFTVPQQGMAEQPNPETGEPEVVPTVEQVPVLTEDDFIAVTDELAAEALTQELQSEWDKEGMDEFMAQQIFETITYGHRDALFQWDADRYCGKLVDLYLFNVWWDRWSKTNHDGKYVVILQVLDAEDAKREFPNVPKNEWSRLIGLPMQAHTSLGFDAMRGSKYENLSYRNVVYRWTLYERGAMFDLTPEEAMAQGLVEPRMELAQDEALDADGFPTVETTERQETTDQGDPLYTLLETGEPTAPGVDNWPQREGVRQADMLGDLELSDGECELSDIPVARNKNIPIADSPYGQGTPHRLQPLQELQNRLLTMIRRHVKYFSDPQKAMPASALQQMQEEAKGMYATAKQTIGVPDDLIHEFGGLQNVIMTLDPPQIQQALIDLQIHISQLMDRIGGANEVLRGEAKSDWSGETVGKLQSAARGPIGAMARATSYQLRYLGGIWAQAIIDYLPSEIAAERNSNYPVAIWEACRQRIKRIGYDVVADVSGASPKEHKFQRLVNLLNSVPTLAQSPTFLELLFESAETPSAEKIAQEVAQLMAAPPQIPSEIPA